VDGVCSNNMSRVLVLAASGFIGKVTAQAFVRRGWTVYGLTRSADKAKQLSQIEVTPIVGKAEDVASWLPVAEASDVVIEAIADYQNPATAGIVAKALTELLHRKPNITVIYTSGTWVYGSSAALVDEHAATSPIGLVSWRPAVEDLYVKAGGVVLRPGLVYGYGGSLTSVWFKQVKEGTIKLAAGQLSSLIHAEDLAELYVQIALHPIVSKGQIFNGVSYVENTTSVFENAKKLINPALHIEFVHFTAGTLDEGLALSQVISNRKAKSLLGWQPSRPELAAGIIEYYHAWAAHL